MAEENKSGADGADAQADATKSAEGSDSSSTTNTGGEDNSGKKADDSAGDGADKKTDDKKSGADDVEPPTRKRNADFIIERKQRKIEKMKSGAGDDDDTSDSDDDEIAPEDKDLIHKEVGKIIKPIVEKQEAEALKSEVNEFIGANPDYKPYEAQIIKYAKHPAYKEVPIEIIANGIAGKDLMRIGAERFKAANEEASKTATGGGSSGGDGGQKYGDMTREQHNAELVKILNKPRN